MEAYCVRCKTKHEIKNPIATFTAQGTAATRGECPVCGTTLFRMGSTSAHAGLQPPTVERKDRKTKATATPAQNPSPAVTQTAAPSDGAELTAYCVRCKTKRPIHEPIATFTAQGTAATRGSCAVCGTTLFRMGRTAAHADLQPPVDARPSSADTTVTRRGNLVIVESPAKAKTIGRYLGKNYKVRASLGHVRDLLRSQLSVDVENNFEPKYRVPNERRETIKDIKKEALQAEQIFLATDLDREGEAIAWHLLEAAEMDPARVKRVKFDEITESAIKAAFADPQPLNMNLVNAQQARRVLDRLVGYSLSPLLWAKVRGRLSAGRVQSVAVRLVVERERAINQFVSQEYWSITAELLKLGESRLQQAFLARLVQMDEQKIGLDKDLNLQTEAQVQPIVADLKTATWEVGKIKRSERRRKPAPPFSTSTLQQDASRRLGFTTRKTMSVAQELYEGIELGDSGTTGLITYMRTDSLNVSKQAQDQAREFITKRYGAGFLPEQPPVYKTKAKGAQEAHEAIRPTAVARDPEGVKEYLTRDQYRLYQLIWQRFVASQMEAALYDTLTVDVAAQTATHAYTFRANGATLRFQGFLVVYEEAADEDAQPNDDTPVKIPALDEGQVLRLLQLLPEQHFTQPPPRYTEASLVKDLEEHGIGRPSTYAPIITTIQQRGYVEKQEKRLYPTETGTVVNDLLVQHFPNIVDTGFTAHMEAGLDLVADGEVAWVPLIADFYQPFANQVSAAQTEMPKVSTEPEYVGRDCPDCGKPLIIRHGRFGKFIGCSGFPNCRHIEALLTDLGVACPKCKGNLVERRTRKNRIFYGCSNYPECDWTSWKRPLQQPCPRCQGLLIEKNKTTAQCTVCQHELALPQNGSAPVEAEPDFD